MFVRSVHNFESHETSARQRSVATHSVSSVMISRVKTICAGMVYVQPSLMGWKPLLQSWIDGRPAGYKDPHKEMIIALCEWLLPPTLRLATKFLSQPVKLQVCLPVLTLACAEFCSHCVLGLFMCTLEPAILLQINTVLCAGANSCCDLAQPP